MTDPIHVPDIPGTRERLCWQQDPATLVRCDRRTLHLGLHTWEWAALTRALAEAEAEAEKWRSDYHNVMSALVKAENKAEQYWIDWMAEKVEFGDRLRRRVVITVAGMQSEMAVRVVILRVCHEQENPDPVSLT